MGEYHPNLIPNIELHDALHAQIDKYLPEVRELLPDLPQDLKVTIDNSHLIKSYGVGGYAKSKDEILVSFDPDFEGDKDQQRTNFIGSVFHESYHVVQGFTGEDNKFQGSPFIEHAIIEGAATKFEVIRGGSNGGWAQYPPDEIEGWFNEVLNMEYTTDGPTWGRIKFYDKETDRRWVLYRVGCYVIDNALDHSDYQIEDFAHMKPAKILELSQLTT